MYMYRHDRHVFVFYCFFSQDSGSDVSRDDFKMQRGNSKLFVFTHDFVVLCFLTSRETT